MIIEMSRPASSIERDLIPRVKQVKSRLIMRKLFMFGLFEVKQIEIIIDFIISVV